MVVEGRMTTYASPGRELASKATDAPPEDTVPPVAAWMSTASAGGPRAPGEAVRSWRSTSPGTASSDVVTVSGSPGDAPSPLTAKAADVPVEVVEVEPMTAL